MLFYIPPKDCNTVPSDHVPELFFDLARRCLIPRKGYGENKLKKADKNYSEKNGIPGEVWRLRDESINAMSSAQGQIC